MEITRAGIIASIGICIYILYKLIGKPDYEFKKQYQKVLTSKEYKVKGQFEE